MAKDPNYAGYYSAGRDWSTNVGISDEERAALAAITDEDVQHALESLRNTPDPTTAPKEHQP